MGTILIYDNAVSNPLLMWKSESFDEETPGKRDRILFDNNYKSIRGDLIKYGLENEEGR